MQAYGRNKKQLLIALTAHKNKLEHEKQSKLQTKLLDLAKKQNLSQLVYDDNALQRRKLYSRWVKSLKMIITSFHQFLNLFDEEMKVHSLPKSMKDENKALFILINSYVQGHWKNIIARKEIAGQGDKALKQIRRTCTTLTESQRNQFHIMLTTMKMHGTESATSYLRRFTVAQKHAEEAGLQYTNNTLVDLFLGALLHSSNPEYKIHALSYKAQRDQKISIPFSTLEEKFQNLDLSFDQTSKRPSQPRHQAKVSTHISVDTPSNKINRSPSHKKRAEKSNKSQSSTSQYSKKREGTRKCYACGDPNHIAPECPNTELKNAWIEKRREKANKLRAAPAAVREASGETTIYNANVNVFSHNPVTMSPTISGLSESPFMRLQQQEKEELQRLIEYGIVTPVLMDDEVSQDSNNQQQDDTSTQDTNSYISLHDDWSLPSHEYYTTTTADTTDDEYSSSDDDSFDHKSEGSVASSSSGSISDHGIPDDDLSLDLFCPEELSDPESETPDNPDDNASQTSQEGKENKVPNVSQNCYQCTNKHSSTSCISTQMICLKANAVTLQANASLANRNKHMADPDESTLGCPSSILNWLCDTGASAHMMPRYADLVKVEQVCSINVEVADGYIVPVTAYGECNLKLMDEKQQSFEVCLRDVLYVPGLTQRLLSIPKFTQYNGNTAAVDKGFMQLSFKGRKVMTPLLKTPKPFFKANKVVQTSVPHNNNKIGHYKPLALEILHQRLGHTRANTILFTSQHRCWNDVIATMNPEKFCEPCNIVTTRSKNRGNITPSNPLQPGHTVYMDLLPGVPGLTPANKYKCMLWLVDRTSRYAYVVGLPDYTTDSVLTGINQFLAPAAHPIVIEPLDLCKIKADAGSQFTSAEFQKACANARIAVNLAAPKHQEQNNFAERTWQSVKQIADKIMVHARLPPIYTYHAILYAIYIHNIFPVKNLVNKNGFPATPFELFFNEKPRIGHLRVFGCPCVFKKWTITSHDGKVQQNKTSQRAVKGVFVGLPTNQQGYLIFMPQSQHIAVSHDVTFDEQFHTAVITNWKPYQDAMTLRPQSSHIHTEDDTLEHTGSAEDLPFMFEEGNAIDNPQNMDIDELSDVSSTQSYMETQGYTMPIEDSEEQTSNEIPQLLDQEVQDSQPSSGRTSGRTRKCITRFEEDPSTYQPTMRQVDKAHINKKHKKSLMHSYKVEVLQSSSQDLDPEEGSDPTVYFPPPQSIHQTIRCADHKKKAGWLKAERKEVKQLIESGTFDKNVKPNPGEPVIDIMEANKIKLNKDGKLDKLKTRLCVRGDIQKKITPDMEDSHSPAAAYRMLKMFLAHAAARRSKVFQGDVIGAFLQAKMRSRVFVKLNKIYGEVFPEFADYCGIPLLLCKAMYGMTLAGKYWYQDCSDWLISVGFKECPTCLVLFSRKEKDGSELWIILYVDDFLYFGTNEFTRQKFEAEFGSKFNIEFQGHAHWYLASRITQDLNSNITIDQSRYAKSIVQ